MWLGVACRVVAGERWGRPALASPPGCVYWCLTGSGHDERRRLCTRRRRDAGMQSLTAVLLCAERNGREHGHDVVPTCCAWWRVPPPAVPDCSLVRRPWRACRTAHPRRVMNARGALAFGPGWRAAHARPCRSLDRAAHLLALLLAWCPPRLCTPGVPLLLASSLQKSMCARRGGQRERVAVLKPGPGSSPAGRPGSPGP